jgi:CRP/FNR family cyclic AMP-dependent transcriptional regulator
VPPDVPLFRTLLSEERADLLAACRRRAVPRGGTVFLLGDAGSELLVVLRGHVAVRVGTPDGDLALLHVVPPGETFGELALLRAHGRRTATATALDDVDLLVLDRDTLNVLRRRHREIDNLLLDLLARHVERLTAHLLEALYVPVDRRVVRRLLLLAQTYGAGQGPITIPLTQDDIAGSAGASRPTVNQVLKHLEEVGVVALHRGRIDVLDRAALQRRAR